MAGETRVRGDYIADTGSVAVIGLVLCLSSMPPLRGPMFWGALSLFGGLLVASRTRSAYVAFLVFLAYRLHPRETAASPASSSCHSRRWL